MQVILETSVSLHQPDTDGPADDGLRADTAAVGTPLKEGPSPKYLFLLVRDFFSIGMSKRRQPPWRCTLKPVAGQGMTVDGAIVS
jgi:hypothetical protein